MQIKMHFIHYSKAIIGKDTKTVIEVTETYTLPHIQEQMAQDLSLDSLAITKALEK